MPQIVYKLHNGDGDIAVSAKGKKGGDDDDKDAAPGGDSIIPTLPDVKMCAAKAIARCARNS